MESSLPHVKGQFWGHVLKATQQGAEPIRCGCLLGCTSWWCTLARHLANRIEPSVCGDDVRMLGCWLMSNYFDRFIGSWCNGKNTLQLWMKTSWGQATGWSRCFISFGVRSGHRKGVRSMRILCHWSTEVLFQNTCRNPGPPGKTAAEAAVAKKKPIEELHGKFCCGFRPRSIMSTRLARPVARRAADCNFSPVNNWQ